jgi:tripeptide aminopeptidase
MDDLVKTFIQLVTIDSPSSNEDIFADHFINSLKPLVDTVTKDKYGNIYARLEGEGTPLFYTGHLDTVEPGRRIKPQIKDGYITSDGTTILGADNKSSLACMLQAIDKLKKEKIKHHTLEFVFTREEETTTGGAINFDYSLLQSKTGYCFDGVNKLGSIILASPFYQHFDLKIIGKAAHASKPQEGINVLNVFKDILSGFPLGRLDDNTVFNMGTFSGGHVVNTIPGEMIIHGEIRGFVEKAINKYIDIFTTVVKKACEKYKATYEMQFVPDNPGYKFAETDSFVIKAKEAMQHVEITPLPLESWAVSDANIFNQHDLTCLNLGDGVEFPHSVQERIKISDMEKLVQLMIELVKL